MPTDKLNVNIPTEQNNEANNAIAISILSFLSLTF